jgi:hypothetical protein
MYYGLKFFAVLLILDFRIDFVEFYSF